MKRKRFSVEQMVGVLKQAEVGVPVAELIRKVGISEQTFYRWKKQYVGVEVDQVRQMKQLQEENTVEANRGETSTCNFHLGLQRNLLGVAVPA